MCQAVRPDRACPHLSPSGHTIPCLSTPHGYSCDSRQTTECIRRCTRCDSALGYISINQPPSLPYAKAWPRRVLNEELYGEPRDGRSASELFRWQRKRYPFAAGSTRYIADLPLPVSQASFLVSERRGDPSRGHRPSQRPPNDAVTRYVHPTAPKRPAAMNRQGYGDTNVSCSSQSLMVPGSQASRVYVVHPGQPYGGQ
jgi:hypothetical protein